MPDRIYSIQYKGRIYDVRASDSVNPNDLFAYVRSQVAGEAQGPKEEENLLEKIPVIGGALAGAADIPLNVVSGLAGTAKTFTDVFGADNVASGALDTVTKYAESLTSAQSREDEKTAAAIRKEAEGKGIWEEVKAAARSLAVNPLDTAASVIGSALPFAAAAATGAGVPAAAALGVASGVGTVKGSISDAVYARAKEAGVSDAQAKAMAEEAQAYGGKNLDQIALGGALGGVASATGLDKMLGRKIAQSAVKDVIEAGAEQQVARGLARRTATGFGAEALPEAAQAGQERFAQNLAQQRAGYETDLTAGVAGQAAFEGLAGGILGGVGGAAERSARPITTDEEIAADRAGLDAEIEATGMPEAKDPVIRARAAEIMQNAGADAVQAVEIAVDERDQQQAGLKRAEAQDVAEGLDLGGREPDVSSIDGAGAVREPAGAPTELGGGPVGGTGVPAGQPVARKAEVKSPLEPQGIIPPIETITPEAQIAEQLAPKVAPAPQVAPAPEVAPAAPSALSEAVAAQAPEIAPAPEQKVSGIAGTPEQTIAAPTAVEEELIAREQGVSPELVAPPIEEAPPTVAETATVEKVAPAVVEIDPTLPEDVQAAQAEINQYNPGFEIRYDAENGRRRYSYGLPGGKNIFASPNLNAVKNRVLNEKPVQPKQVVEGVPVKQMPAGEAKGIKPESKRQPPLQIEKPSIAGKLTPAQEQQQELLLFEIDEARKARQISNAERTELVEMLRTPQGKELAKSREWTLAAAIQSDIDKLTEEGRNLRTEEKLAEKQNELTPAKRKEFKKRAEEIAERTKAQSAELAKAKSGIYQRTREKLAERKGTRQKRIEQLKRNYERGLISEVVFKREMREARPEPVMFRKSKGKAAGITLEELNAAVKDITDRWGARLEPKLVQSASDLPPAIRKEIEDLNRTDAFGFYKDGKAYLIADNMNGVQDVAPTLYHEALGHLGLRERFREGLDAILTDIHRTNKNVAALADKWLSANQDLYAEDENPVARAVEEVLASASEAGPLRASRFDKLTKFIKDFARQYLGLDFKFSDREVRTILAMAHEQALSGEGTVMGSSSMMFSAPEQQKAKSTTADAQVDIENNIERIATTTADRIDMDTYSRGVLGNLGAAINAKSIKNWFGSLTSPTAAGGFIGRGGLNAMPTDGTLDYGDTLLGDIPAMRELRNAVDAADKMNGTRSASRRMLNKMVSDLKEYLLSNADPIVVKGKKLKALPVAMDYGNANNIDMVALMEAKSLDDALNTDQIWRRYSKLLKDPALKANKKAEYEGRLKKREGEIAGAMQILGDLGKQGRSLYKRIRDMNRDMYLRRQFLMNKRVESLRDAGLSDDAVSKLMVSIRAEQERLNDRVNAPSEEDAHKDYPEVPLGLFHREYFPKRRYGRFWLRIKKTKFGEPILRFYEDGAERDADWEAAAEELGVSKEDQTYLDRGNNAQQELGDDFDTGNAFIKTLNLVSDIDPATFSENKKAKLRSDVYQLYLLSTPEGSGRKQFIKSKNRLGWSSDILRTVGTTAEEYVSDIARLRFAPDIDRALDAAKKSIESIPVSQKTLAREFITNIEGRINGEMEPQPKGLANKIVPWANQLAYISFLTAPATALVQVTALPMRVAPNLWGKYGLAATTRAMGRYMNVYSNLPKFESKTKAERKTFRIPTLMESNIVKNSKRHRDALTRATDEYGLIMPLSEFTMGQERTPQTAAQGRRSELLQKSYDAMTYLFDASEQLTREVAFMAAYDLEYDKLANAKLSPEERQNKAILAAKDTVNYTLGNYTNLNRPPIMKGSELARALFLFKQYSVITTRFFVQGARAIFGPLFGGKTSRADQVAAMKEMTGVLGMGFLMGGVVGLPLYTLGMMTLQTLQDMFDDDEDRKERMKKNPFTADSVEMQFRYEWLPEHFSQPMTTDANGKKITLGDIILNGAVSEATGWNFGSRVSLDLAGMWFRAPKDADTWSQTINNALVENIPGASASLNIVSMGEEIAKGDVAKGLELGLPAAFRAPFKAYRLGTEGLRTQTEKIKIKNEEISNSEIIGAVLGFNPTQIAKVQQENRDVLNSKKELADKKSELLGDYKRAVRRIQNGDPDGQEKAREAFQNIMEYNKKVGNPYFGISYANIYKSLTGAASEEKYDIQGMGLNEVESYYAEKTIGKE